MAVLLITYYIKNAVRRSKILREFKANSSTSIELSKSSYAVKTDDAVGEVYDFFKKKYIGRGDQLYVITLTSPCAGNGSSAAVNNWLIKNLPKQPTSPASRA